MRRSHVPSLFATVICAVFPGCGGAERPPEEAATPSELVARVWEVAPDVRIEQIASGVWMHTTWATVDDGSRYLSNGLIVREGEAITLVDTGWGVAPTKEILGWIDAELGLPVTRAVITHFHADKMSGTPVLEERGVEILGHALTAELGRGQGVPLPTPLDGLDLGLGVDLGRLEVFYPGPAHTHDNVAVWVGDASILHGGCAIRPGGAGGMGNTADASLEGWADAMRRLQARYPTATVVIPSHGDPGGTELLEHTIALAEAANASP